MIADSPTLQYRNVSAPGRESIRSGEILELLIEDPRPEAEFLILIQHDELLNLTPVRPWSAHRSFLWLASAPGRYRFVVERRVEREAVGTDSVTVRVEGGEAFQPVPTELVHVSGAKLWAPSGWEKGYLGGRYEAEVDEALVKRTPRGGVAWDLGANLGVHAIALSRALGPAGRLYCVEANPYCVYFLRANLQANGVENATILPVAIDEAEGESAFLIDFGNSAIGTADSSPLINHKVGQRIRVECHSMDELVRRGLVAPPDLVKIDIEGNELRALRGMTEVLRESRPTLVLEIHGAALALGIFELLDELGYRHRLFPGPESWSVGAEIEAEATNRVFQCVSVHPRRGPAFLERSGRQ